MYTEFHLALLQFSPRLYVGTSIFAKVKFKNVSTTKMNRYKFGRVGSMMIEKDDHHCHKSACP
jgi:hypothetical protein